MRLPLVTPIICLCAALSGCAFIDRSPPIVCDVNGELVETGFTFNSLKRVVAREHGQADAQSDEWIKSRSVEIYFKTLDDGRLLAEEAFWVRMNGTKDTLVPAVFFDLAEPVPGETNAPAFVE